MIIDVTVILETATATATAVNDIAITVTLNDEIVNPEATFCERVDTCLGISEDGSATKYLNEQGDWVEVSSGSSFSGIFILTGTNSGISGYELMVPLEDYVAGALQSVTKSVGTSPVLLEEFVSASGDLDGVALLHGFFTAHYETEKSTGGQSYYTYFELYKRTSGGTETLICTSDNSTETSSNTTVQQTVQALLNTDVSFGATDLLVIKIYAQMLSGTHDITLYWDNGTDAHLDLPISPLSYIPENVDNKTTTITGNESSTTLYSNVKGVVDWIKQGMTALLSSLSLTKATPVDADSLLLNDSADSNKLKLVTWVNAKATLKTYFDTIYAAAFTPSNIDIVDDFIGYNSIANSGSAADLVSSLHNIRKPASVALTFTSYAGRYGVAKLATTSNTLPNTYIVTNNAHSPATGNFTYTYYFKLNGLPGAGKVFDFCAGLFNTVTPSTIAEGIYLYYRYDNNSGKFSCITKSGGNTQSNNSGITVVDGDWYKLEIVYNGTDVKFYLDNVLVATNTDYIPTTNMYSGILHNVSGGSFTVIGFEVDLIRYRKTLTTARI